VSLIITEEAYAQRMSEVAAKAAASCRAVAVGFPSLGASLAPPGEAEPFPDLCSILYTSGTTGRPKGCMLTNETHLAAGERYRSMGGRLEIFDGQDRFYNPTPFHHTNILVVNLSCVILTGNCLVMPERFTATHWWRDVVS